jgi:hypothetical protein
MTQISTSKQAQANTEHAMEHTVPFPAHQTPQSTTHAYSKWITMQAKHLRPFVCAATRSVCMVCCSHTHQQTKAGYMRMSCLPAACCLTAFLQLLPHAHTQPTSYQHTPWPTNTTGGPTSCYAQESAPCTHLLTSPAKRLSTHHDHPPASRQAACQHRSNLRLQGYRVTPTVTLKPETKPTAAAAATCCCSHQLLMPCQPSAASARPVLLPAWQ